MVDRAIACVGAQLWDSCPAFGFTLCISEDGRVYSFGYHTRKAHGQKHSAVCKPKIIPSLRNIISISCGYTHTVCLDTNGNVYAFGEKSQGQIPLGNNEPDRRIIKCIRKAQKMNLPPIKQISCGDIFTICLSENGELYSFGNNRLVQYMNEISTYFPQKIESLKDIEFVQCGPTYIIFKTSNNDFYTWGFHNQNTPVKREDWPKDIIDVKCGMHHFLVLTENKEVYSYGSNINGQLGRYAINFYSPELKKISLSDIIRIECGNSHSMCLDSNNTLYVFGQNKYGQLGLGNRDDIKKPTKHTISDIIDFSCGGDHSFVKTSNNEIYAFGDNRFSQLGITTEEDYVVAPIRVLEDKGHIWCSNINKPAKAKSARSIVQ